MPETVLPSVWDSCFHKARRFGQTGSNCYSTDVRQDKTRLLCRELLSLYLLPHNKIEGRFNYIKENTTYDLVLRFCCYIENPYINNTIWPPSLWSMFMQFVRTNNNVEGTHNNLKAVVGKLQFQNVNYQILKL